LGVFPAPSRDERAYPLPHVGAKGLGIGKVGYDVGCCPDVDDRGRGLLYLGIALLAIVVFFVGHWALATYYPLDYGAETLVLFFLLAFTILGLYASFRFYQLRHPR
jgi:hypothetical protein